MKKYIDCLKKYYTNNKEYIYIFSFLVYVVASLLSNKLELSEICILVLKATKYLALVPILIKILLFDIQKYNNKTKIMIVLLFILVLVSAFFNNHYRTLFRYLVLIIGSYNIDIKKIMKYFYRTEIIILTTIIILSIFDILPNSLFTRNGNIRQSIGFAWPTFPSLILFTLTCVYLYIKKTNVKMDEYIFLLLLNILMFIITNTRFELLCSILIIIMSLMYKYIKSDRFNSIVVLLAKFIMPIMTVVSVVLCFTYDPEVEFYTKMNDASSDRIALMSEAVHEYGLPLLGDKISFKGQKDKVEGEEFKQTVVDNGYINLILNYGFIVLMVLECLYYVVVTRVGKHNIFVSYLIIILALHSFINPQLMQIVYNPFMLFLVFAIIDDNKKRINI